MNNPDPQYRGLPQKMKLDNGDPKGLQQTLEERSFNVTGMQAKCSPICLIEMKAAAWLVSSASRRIFNT